MNCKKILTGCVLLAASAMCWGAPASPWDAWRQGYTMFEKGQQQKDKGDYRKALRFFENARDSYQQVRDTRPDWNQKIITGRIADCDKAIAAVKLLLEDPALEIPAALPSARSQKKEDFSTSTESAYPQIGLGGSATVRNSVDESQQKEFLKLRADNERYKNKLLQTMVELDDLRRQLAQNRTSAAEIGNLMREQRSMQQKYALLQKRYASLEEQSRRPDSRIAEMQNQLVEARLKYDLLQKKYELNRKQLTDAQTQASESEQLKRSISLFRQQKEKELKHLKDNLEELQNMQRAGEEERLRLRSQLDRLGSDLKSRGESLLAREEELKAIRQKLEIALSGGEGAKKLNEKILQENRQLHEQNANLLGQLSSGNRTLRQQQDAEKSLTRELLSVREKLKTQEETQIELKKELTAQRKVSEHDRIAAAFAEKENAKLRQRNQQLGEELKEWSEKAQQLEKRLASQVDNTCKLQEQAESSQRKAAENAASEKLRGDALAVRNRELENELIARQKKTDEEHSAMLKERAGRLSAEAAAKKDAEIQKKLVEKYQLLVIQLQKLKELQSNFAALQKENRNNREQAEKVSGLQIEIRNLSVKAAQIDQLRKTIADLQKENQSLSDRNRQLQILVKDQAEFELIRKRAEALQKEVRQLKAESAAARQKLRNAGEFKEKCTLLESQKQTLADEKNKLESLVSELRKNEQRLQKQAAAGENAQRSLDNAKNELQSAAQQRSEQQKELNRLQENEKNLQQKLAAATAENQKLRPEAVKSQLLPPLQEELQQLKKNLAILRQENRQLAASEKELTLVRPKLQEKERQIQQLEESGKNSASALTEVRQELQQLRRKMDSETIRLNQEKNTVEAQKNELAKKIDILTSAAVKAQELHASAIALQTQEVNRLKKENQKLSAGMTASEPLLLQARQESEKLRSSLHAELLKNQQQKAENNQLVKELDATKQERTELSRQKALLTRENSELKKSSADRTQLATENQKLASAIQKNAAQRQTMQQTLETEKRKLAQSEQQCRELQRRNQELAMQQTEQQKNLQSLSRELQNQRQLSERQQQNLKSESGLTADLRRQTDLLTQQLSAQKKTVLQLENELKKQQQTIRQSSAALTAERSAAKQTSAEIQQYKTRLAQLEKTLADTRQQLQLELQNKTVKKSDDELELLQQQIAELQRENKELAAMKMPAFSGKSPVVDDLPDLKISDRTTTGSTSELVAAGKQAEKQGNLQSAIWNYRAALEKNPTQIEAAGRLGILYLKREDFRRAEPLLALARSVDPGDTTFTAANAQALIGLGKFGNALALIDPLLAKHPKNPDLNLLAIQAYAGSGQPRTAIELIEKMIQNAPNFSAPYREYALLLAAMPGEEKKAAKYYQEYLALGGKTDPMLEPKLGKLLSKKREIRQFMSSAAAEAEKSGDWNAAVWYYRQLLAEGEPDAMVAAKAAFAYLQLKQYPAAAEVLAMNPASAYTELVGALLQYCQQEYAGAARRANNARKLNRNAPLHLSGSWGAMKKVLKQELAKPVSAAGKAAKDALLDSYL